ncbi:hypothetical protein HBI56_220230 [Parastagonospora nodorum]|uniref:Uncharacterized protein n=1 Tax=Phaeosphaeria nodorum (strain SN15 / ATCC MYA-4574 / FGSC 10173) TaxID=321614 RepID=A0A7U2ESU3_PHANO|nr:hypothetical protein HBH56_006760 [Parastagonospora nodorum]QRC90500.1 hypothetical protein JI435_400400 [Parastagonospora nodorum SN15]KAH3937821.1 hypothetical protein HBH54_006760 [Parastagonospora nodorum]KAH3940243.1 hypothetical protein HBH53_220440 [Parastagonospora nodorum]KAH3960074.1 hypothetical protein HBH52_238660 [Parastagonospora nodorum]
MSCSCHVDSAGTAKQAIRHDNSLRSGKTRQSLSIATRVVHPRLTGKCLPRQLARLNRSIPEQACPTHQHDIQLHADSCTWCNLSALPPGAAVTRAGEAPVCSLVESSLPHPPSFPVRAASHRATYTISTNHRNSSPT